MLKNCIFGVCDKRERTLLDRQRNVRSRVSKICGNHGRENANVYPREAADSHAGRLRREV